MSNFIYIRHLKCSLCWKWSYFKTKNITSTTWDWKRLARLLFNAIQSLTRKQTFEMLDVIVLNWILQKFHNEVEKTRRKQMWSKHLLKEIENESQIKNSRCFFMNKYNIECSCVDNNSFVRFVSSTDVNLIMISTFIIINWIDHVVRYLRDEILLESWNLTQIYVRDKLNHFAFRLRIENRDLLKRTDENFKSLKCHEDASTIVIITTKECYYQHVDQLFIRKTIFKRTFRSRLTIIEVSMNFAWDRACINETHTEQKSNNEAVLIFKKIDFHVRKWFLIETSFENSSEQMIFWIQILQLDWIQNLISSTNSWSRLKQYRLQLKHCTFDKITIFNNIHKRFLKSNVENKSKLSNYIDKLSIVLNILWLRRIIDRFKFFDQLLIDVLFNIHQSIICSLSERLQIVVNSQIDIIRKRLKNELTNVIIKWKHNFKILSKSKMNINNWLMMIRRMRILNIFSRLNILSETTSLSFIEQENTNNEWVILKKNRIYELQEINFSYELYLNDICFVEYYLKIVAINELITLKWNKRKKIVFTIMRSTNAMILYWINN
jgi:hypothetical protein